MGERMIGPDGAEVSAPITAPAVVTNEASSAAPSPSPALNRLVMAAASAWELPPREEDSDKSRYGDLLRCLLDAGADGEAWIGRDSADGPVKYFKHGSLDADELINKLEKTVEIMCSAARDSVNLPRGERRQSLGKLRHRVVLDPARFRSVTQPGATNSSIPADGTCDQTAVHLIALDLRFDFYLDKPLCHLNLSVWSARPLNDRYVPSDWPSKSGPQPIPIAQLRQYELRYRTILRQMITFLEHLSFKEAEFRVYGHKHVLPIFWVAVPAKLESDAGNYRSQRPFRRRLTDVFLDLGDPGDCVATDSVVNGQFDVVRRFRNGRDEPRAGNQHLKLSRAHYLIIPGEPPDAALAADRQARRRAYQEQEDLAADVVIQLTDLEARGASSLHEVHRDLQIWHNHLKIYDRVIRHGTLLWDGLSTHLVTRRRAMRRVHHAIELLHQILLQGVADLAQLSNRTRDCVARIENAADQLHSEYDDQLTEFHPGQINGLRGALAHIGLFEQVTQYGHKTQEEANRAKTIYDDLLRTIGFAFDEWRVRESDVAQRLSGALGVFLALIGIATVLDATVALRPNNPNSTSSGDGMVSTSFAVGVSWVVGIALLIAVGVLAWAWARSGRLGSRLFRRQYSGRRGNCRGVWQLLKDISTHELDMKAHYHGDDMTDWADLDTNLATRFAELWDHTSNMCGTNRHDDLNADIKGQSRQIEQWGLHALLLTERARRMHSYVLPKLTCLYLACTRLPGSFLTGPGTADGGARRSTATPNSSNMPTAIDFNEFALSMKHLGLTWGQADQLKTWLLHQHPKNARDLLELLTTNLGLAADMDQPAVESMLKQIKTDPNQTGPPKYPTHSPSTPNTTSSTSDTSIERSMAATTAT